MKSLIGILFSLSLLPVIAQTSMSSAHYDYYRQRFRDQYILMDTAQGGGIPVAERRKDLSCTDSWRLGVMCNGKGMKDGKKGLLDWSDGTTYMGHYLAVLGTEYAWFSRTGRSTDSTIMELSLVIEALKRLDEAAEIKYGLQPKDDGFLLRDDVDENTGAQIDPNFGCVKSGFVCSDGIEDGNMMSQDQIIHLLFGSAFVVKFLPREEKNIYSGHSIKEEIQIIADRMMRYISKRGWVIYDPNDTRVPFGYSAVGYSYGLSRAGKEITGKSYGNLVSNFAGLPLWNTLQNTRYQNTRIHHEVNLSMQLCLMSVAGVRHRDIFEELCIKGNLQVHLLAEAVLHDHTGMYDQKIFFPLLNEVPLKGTCDQSEGCENVKGWRSTNRSGFTRIGVMAGVEIRAQSSMDWT